MLVRMARRFNTAGDCRFEWHYMIPPIPRLPEAAQNIANLDYFVVHAPRQTGKTTTLIALARELTSSGKYAALHFSCEEGRAYPDDATAAQRVVLNELRLRAQTDLPAELQPPPFDLLDQQESLIRLNLSKWARSCSRPVVLFFDEIDALHDNALLSVLSQLRSGFSQRPTAFPASIVLCGLRDVRDYKAASGGDPNRLGSSSPFNVKVESLELANFTVEQVAELYGQHTEETGQAFAVEAISRAHELTGGQPWLVNALAREIVEKLAIPRSQTITMEDVEVAKERLILARATHLDSLASKLMEVRVKRVLGPLLAGALHESTDDTYNDDVLYCRDLGLITTRPVRIANPIYKEIIVRVLGAYVEGQIETDPHRFVASDGTLDIRQLLEEFVSFWIENGDVLVHGYSKNYHESAPQLVFMAYLQRVVNGGGTIDREYGIGRKRIDLLIRWPYQDAGGKRQLQREAIELKVWRDKQVDPLQRGLEQLDAYLAKMGLDTGILIIFDRRSQAKAIEKRTQFKRTKTPAGRRVVVLRA